MPLMSPKRPQIHLLFEELVPWRVLAAVGHLITRSTRAPNNWLHEGHLRLLSLPDSLDHPILLAERAAIVLFHPQGHAAVVEGMIAFSPDHNTILLFVFSLTSKTGILNIPVKFISCKLSTIILYFAFLPTNLKFFFGEKNKMLF